MKVCLLKVNYFYGIIEQIICRMWEKIVKLSFLQIMCKKEKKN